MRIRALFSATLAACLLFGGSAAAQPGGERDFRSLVKEATEAYGRGELQRSVELLRQAYAIKADPRLLYNIGKAEEGLGHLDEAIAAYRDYLEKDPNAQNRDVVSGRVTVLENQRTERTRQQHLELRLKAERAEARGDREAAIAGYRDYLAVEPQTAERKDIEARIRSLQEPPKKTAKPSPTPPPKTDERPSRSPWPWVVTAVGAAGLATGATFAFLSRQKYDDAKSARTGQESDDLRKTGDSYTTIGNVALIGGGVILAGGVTWLLIGAPKPTEQARVRLSVSPNALWIDGSL